MFCTRSEAPKYFLPFSLSLLKHFAWDYHPCCLHLNLIVIHESIRWPFAPNALKKRGVERPLCKLFLKKFLVALFIKETIDITTFTNRWWCYKFRWTFFRKCSDFWKRMETNERSVLLATQLVFDLVPTVYCSECFLLTWSYYPKRWCWT